VESQPQMKKIMVWLDKALLHTLPKGKAAEALLYKRKNGDILTA